MWGGLLPASRLGSCRRSTSQPRQAGFRRDETEVFFPSSLILGPEGPGNNSTRRKIADP